MVYEYEWNTRIVFVYALKAFLFVTLMCPGLIISAINSPQTDIALFMWSGILLFFFFSFIASEKADF